MQEKISIIVPVYGVEKYLDRCVNSLINQSYTNLEIILVDDGSPDNCPKMCDEWAEKDSRIVVIHKENGGLSDARNAGLDICTGDYITFVDSDDLIDKDFIKILYDISKQKDADIVACSTKRFKNEPIIKQDKPVIIKEFSVLEVIKNTYQTNDMEFLTAWGKLYKKFIFANLRYTKGVYHEDEYIIHHLVSLANKFVLTSQELYYYYYNENSITGSGYKLKRIDLLKALANRGSFLRENYPGLYKESFATFFVYRCIDLYFEIPKDFKDRKLAKKETKKYFNMAYKGLKGIKSPSKKRFIIFKICPSLYRRLFR